ncbi:DUF6626 family protein [Paramagnetospirillum caucaseum]|uniref:DUF6626 family protein n=1 Tax=Paramagnetospirillum caucaseum TaxID=1244869 RepID=UPI0012692BC6|nr:DUF6626 family protein [Paramagnetospirillum caucaseum]
MLEIDEIYRELSSLGAVQSGRRFGEIMNRSESYLSSSKSRGRRPSVEALLALILNIDGIVEATIDEIKNCNEKGLLSEYEQGIKGLRALEIKAWADVWARVEAGRNS